MDHAYACLFCEQGIQAYAPYTEFAKSLMVRYKGKREKNLATVLAPLYSGMLSNIDNPVLLPVPASRRGYALRGFDQMFLICKHIRGHQRYPMLKAFKQAGKEQSKFLSLEERKHHHSLSLRNIDTKIAQYQKENYTFVLLDDITTSGSTLQTCRTLLQDHYGIEALSLVFAMA